jgi:uncharacterized protein (TIGR02145 family)
MAEGTLEITISNQTGTVLDIAPAGWHVPTKAEFDTLVTTLGGYTVAGGKLKEVGLTYWLTPNVGADNSSGFNGKGSGNRSFTDGSFNYLKNTETFHTSDNYINWGTYGLVLFSNTVESGVFQQGNAIDAKRMGYSIRLIKDDSTDPGTMTDYDRNVYPTVKIGAQVWMAANLKVTHYNDGTPIPLVTDNAAWAALTTGAMCWYDNIPT